MKSRKNEGRLREVRTNETAVQTPEISGRFSKGGGKCICGQPYLTPTYMMDRGTGYYQRSMNDCKTMYEFYTQTEILTNDGPEAISYRDDILKLKENGKLTIRGMSTILKVPIMITFMNQLNIVEVMVAQATDQFRETDYQKFNLSLCQYMDSIELAMYR